MGINPPILSCQTAVTDPDPRSSLVAVVERNTGVLTVFSGDESHVRAEVLVREGGRSLGHIKLDGAHDFVERAVSSTPVGVPARGWTDGAGRDIPATIIICTLGRNPLLTLAVQAALAQRHGHFNVVVVDNDPLSGNARRLLAQVSDPRLSIIDEPQRGLSRARNQGIRVATGEVVAFSDDDAILDPAWLASLLDVFASAPPGEVGAVTGPVFAAELECRSQRFFESRGGFPKGLQPLVWSLRTPSPECARLGNRADGGPLFPLATARVGAGASMAFTRAALDALHEFDVCLGAGAGTNGGEDLDAFTRVLRAGFVIVYNPDAVVHHVHRRDMEGLEKQIHGNGTGMAALLVKSLCQHPVGILTLLKRFPKIVSRVAPGTERMKGSEDDVPPVLGRQEVRGFLRGPFLYLRECVAQRLRKAREWQ